MASTASAASCSPYIAGSFYTDGTVWFQAQLYCTTGAQRVDKVEFLYGGQWYDGTHNQVLNSANLGAVVTVGANGAAYRNYYRAAWCNPAQSIWASETYWWRLHNFASNSWGPVHVNTTVGHVITC